MLIRGHHDFDGQFTQVPNAWLRDPKISLGAKGLIAQLMSHSPGWTVTIQNLAKQNGCGKDRIRTYIRELVEAGYLSRSSQQRHNEKGYLAGFDYTTQDPPLAGYPTKVQPTKVQPTKENPPLKNTIEKNTIEKNIETEEFETFWKIYPNRLGKGEARVSFAKAVTKVGLESVMNGVERLAGDPNLPPKQYIPRPSTWLNQERWDDDPYPLRVTKKAETKRLIDEWARTEEQ
jgi:hypothetical protein